MKYICCISLVNIRPSVKIPNLGLHPSDEINEKDKKENSPGETRQGMSRGPARATRLLRQHLQCPSGTGMLCCKGPGCITSRPAAVSLSQFLVIPAPTVLFIADLLFLCISKEMQIWNTMRRMKYYSQCFPNSLVSVRPPLETEVEAALTDNFQVVLSIHAERNHLKS